MIGAALPGLRPAILVLLLVASACQTDNRRPEMLRFCDASGCSDRHRSSTTPLRDTTDTAAIEDPNSWRGESVAELRSAAMGGDGVAAYKLGLVRMYGLGGTPIDNGEAARYLEIAADSGLPWAQYRLAELYREGKGVRRDQRRAIALTMAAAGRGHPLASYNLGLSHLTGDGVMRDEREAARYMTFAAEQGVADAQYNLALMYFRGQGVPVRLYQALQLMRSAAENGHLKAQAATGRLYLTGLDTMGQDMGEAMRWLRTAAGRGDRESQKLLDDIERRRQAAEAYEREVRLRQAETQAYWTGLILASWLAPRPVIVVY